MLGIGGRFAGARGMVPMPNLSNLSPTAATSALTAAGLRLGTVSEVESSNSSDNEKVFNQSVAAGTLVDYDSAINYSYYRYVPPAIVYTLDTSQRIQDGGSVTETGCNRTPNLQNASNQYYYCTRTLTTYKYRLLANGVWDGMSYGGYFSEYSTWDCSFIPDQCGNTRIDSTRTLVSEGTCQPNNTRTNIYSYRYQAGNILTFSEVVACTYVNRVPLYTKKVYTTSTCIGGGGCPAGYRLFNTVTVFSDGSEEITASNQQECCPCPTTCTDTPYFYFPCDAGFRRCTYRTECRDCTGTLISDTRYSCPSLCCSADVLVGCTDWSGSSGGQSRTCTYRRCNGSTYTVVETRCTASCGSWTNTTPCITSKRSQSRTCTRTDCSTYTETRTVAC
jgi:hypothetical protein